LIFAAARFASGIGEVGNFPASIKTVVMVPRRRPRPSPATFKQG